MTLDDAIKHCQQVADESDCECADEHRQLAEWLQELKEFKQMQKACKDMEISCFKCHGLGTYNAPILDDNGEWTDEWESCHCEVCGGTGKITLAFYEELQKGARDKE